MAKTIKSFEPDYAPDSFAYKASARILSEQGIDGAHILMEKCLLNVA